MHDLSRTLTRSRLSVKTRSLPNPHGHADEAIRSTAVSLDCDLLVKGAHTQGWLQQFIIDGVTSTSCPKPQTRS
jgi:nucleotide-binding universal stress UspA family protein